MAGAFPISSSSFETMGIRSNQDTILSKSISGKKLVRQIGNQRFSFTAKIITGTRSHTYGELMSFIMKQRSRRENFTIIFSITFYKPRQERLVITLSLDFLHYSLQLCSQF